MPEMTFTIRWPDGTREPCYSPSLVIKDYLTPGETYALDDFLTRSRTALMIASERVEAKYGFPCSRALGQLARLESAGRSFSTQSEARVAVESFDA
jgi:uncharacterized repeat protein (TIGR04042 family)